MKKYLYLFISLLIFSCSAPSGRPQKRYSWNPSGGNFKAYHNKRAVRPPQMGFYSQKKKTSFFTSAKYTMKYTFSSGDTRHRMINDRRTSSQSYANQKSREQNDRMKKNFVKGRIRPSSKSQKGATGKGGSNFSGQKNTPPAQKPKK
jgi:hypothetical protein